MTKHKPITEDGLALMERQVRNLTYVGWDVAPITVLSDQLRLIAEVRRLWGVVESHTSCGVVGGGVGGLTNDYLAILFTELGNGGRLSRDTCLDLIDCIWKMRGVPDYLDQGGLTND